MMELPPPKLERLPYRFEMTNDPNWMVLITRDTGFICGVIERIPQDSYSPWRMHGLYSFGFGAYRLETLIDAIGYVWDNYWRVKYHLGPKNLTGDGIDHTEMGFDNRGEPHYAYEKEIRAAGLLPVFWGKVDGHRKSDILA